MTITLPTGTITLTTSEWLGDTSPEAVRFDIAVLALAAAEAAHRVHHTAETALRVAAAEVTYLHASRAMFGADEEIA